MENLKIWNQVKQPPTSALKNIGAGRLKGMTDISPIWRIEKATELFGPCGDGWKYEIKKLWSEDGANGEKLSFALIDLYVNYNGWGLPIPGIGGSKMIAKEKEGLHSSDEAYKMAVTDALSVAFKCLGFGADVYAGRFDGSKYKVEEIKKENIAESPKEDPYQSAVNYISLVDTQEKADKLTDWINKHFTGENQIKLLQLLEKHSEEIKTNGN